MARMSLGSPHHSTILSTTFNDSTAKASSLYDPARSLEQTSICERNGGLYRVPEAGILKSSKPAHIQSSKRQKIVEESGNHKFVSQKRWKFTQGQTWLPARVSSKAQNASRVTERSKAEPVIPEHSIEVEGKVLIQNLRGCGLAEHAHDNDERANDLLICSNSTPFASQPVTMEETAHILATPCASRSDQKFRHLPIAQVLPESLPLAPADFKSVQGDSTLSLEKDAARIAALIAVKKEENESTMFRERLLQRQMQHKNQKEKDLRIEGEAIEQPLHNIACAAEDEIITDTSEAHTSCEYTKISGSYARTNPFKKAEAADLRLAREARQWSAKTGISLNGRLMTKTTKTSRPVVSRSTSVSGSNEQASIPEEWKMLFSTAAISGTPIHFQKTQGTIRRQPTPISHINESGPFEMEDTDLAAQLAASTDQLVPRASSQNKQLSRSQCNRPLHSAASVRPISTSLPFAKPPSPQRADSTPCATGRKGISRTADLTASPLMTVSSQCPAGGVGLPVACIDIAATKVYETPHVLDDHKIKVALSEEITSDERLHFSRGRQTWTISSQNANKSGVLCPNTYPGSPSEAQPPSVAGDNIQPRHPKQLPRVSKSNVLYRDVHANSGSAVNKSHPKTRVNMFGDTKGIPITAWEVIQQIEMT